MFFRSFSYRRVALSSLCVALFLTPSVALLVELSWTLDTVDAGFTSARMYIIDVDGDGDMDLAGIATTPDDVAWYENDGSETFTKRTIDSNAPGVRDVQVADVDNDGDIDFVISQVDSTPDGVYWYDNDGSESFTKRTISTADNPIYIDIADINEDGELDVLATLWSAGDLIYYENLGGTPSTFSTTVIDNDMTSPDDVEAADIDGDNDIDIITTHGSTSVQFYENDGSETFTETTFAGILTSTASYDTDILDIDGDTDLDMLIANGSNLYLFKSDGNDNPTFTRSTVDSSNSINNFASADFDGDGDIDIVGADENTGAKLIWYDNDGEESFTAYTIDSDVTYPWKVESGDIDGDGDIDIVVGSNNGIELWLNGGNPSVSSLSNSGGGAAARQRREMIKRMREGIYTYQDTESPSLSDVGIFVPKEPEDMSDTLSALPDSIVQTGKKVAALGTVVEKRVLRARNKLTQFMLAMDTAEPESEAEEVEEVVTYESPRHERFCTRALRVFAGKTLKLERFNSRLSKRFGWLCPLP